jgi:hypothetical protein
VHGERAKALDFWCCDTQITPTQLALKKKRMIEKWKTTPY